MNIGRPVSLPAIAALWGFEIFGGSHWYFGEGSSYSKPDKKNNGNVYVGLFAATSNTLTIAKGAAMDVNSDLFIGCGNSETVAPVGVVHVAGTLRIGGWAYMGRHRDQQRAGCAERSVLVVDGGVVETVNSGDMRIGAVWGGNHTYSHRSEIVVRNGGRMDINGDFVRYEWSGGQSIVVDGGTMSVAGEFSTS